MKFLFIIVGILALIVAFYFSAKLIVNFIPKKLHWIISLLLLCVSVWLGYKIYDSVVADIKFKDEKIVRYQKAVDQLKLIRDAEVKYRMAKNIYTKSYDTLIHFIEYDSMPLTRTYEKTRTVIERGVPKVVEYKETDTIGWRMVKEEFKGKLYKNMMNVPGTNAKFELNTGFIEKGINKYKAPVFEAKVHKAVVLEGLRKDLIDRELIIVGVDEINGDHIVVGTLEEVKETGNWPPSYDSREDSE